MWRLKDCLNGSIVTSICIALVAIPSAFGTRNIKASEPTNRHSTQEPSDNHLEEILSLLRSPETPLNDEALEALGDLERHLKQQNQDTVEAGSSEESEENEITAAELTALAFADIVSEELEAQGLDLQSELGEDLLNSDTLLSGNDKEFKQFVYQTYSAQIAEANANFFSEIASSIQSIEVEAQALKDPISSTTADRFLYDDDYFASIANELQKALHKFSEQVRHADGDFLLVLEEHRHLLLMGISAYFEARGNFRPSVDQYKNFCLNIVASLSKGTQPNINDLKSYMKLAMESDQKLATTRSYLNANTAQSALIAVVLGSDAITRTAKLFAGSKCTQSLKELLASKLPIKLRSATTRRRLVNSTLKLPRRIAEAGILAFAGISLYDRYQDRGMLSLTEMGTYIDILIIASFIPIPAPAALASTRSFTLLGRSIRLSTLARALYRTKDRSTKFLIGTAGSYGAWQLLRAETIANDLRIKGHEVNASEIRLAGAINLGLSLVGVSQKSRLKSRYREWPSYKNYRQLLRRRTLQRYKKSAVSLLPLSGAVKGAKTMARAFKAPTALKGWTLGGKGLFQTVGLTAYQAFTYSSWAMLYFAYPDFSFNRNRTEPPPLEPGEIAVVMNGFSHKDMLYWSFATDYANREELRSYGQDRLHMVDFSSADDFFVKIEELSKIGKIKYLKVMAHGVPGLFVPSAETDVFGNSEERITVDANYLLANQAEIQRIALKSMSPNAVVAFISCLVGATLKTPVTYKGLSFETDDGDQFIDALHQTLLIQGATVDSSRRAILGIDGAVGPVISHMLNKELENPEDLKHLNSALQRAQAQLLSPPNLFETQTQSLGDSSEIESEGPDLSAITGLTGGRIISMARYVYEIVYKFGWNVENGEGIKKHRQDVLEPLPRFYR